MRKDCPQPTSKSRKTVDAEATVKMVALTEAETKDNKNQNSGEDLLSQGCTRNLAPFQVREMDTQVSDINLGLSCTEHILRIETGKLGVNWWIKLHQTDFEVRNR